MANLFDYLDKEKMKLIVTFADDDSCFLDVNYSKSTLRLQSNYFDVVHIFDVSCFDKDGNEVGDVYFDVTDESAVHIGDIEVCSKYRHNGYGSKMLRFIDCIAQESGINKVDGIFAPEDREKAKKFYHRNGFRLVNIDGVKSIYKELEEVQDFRDIIINFSPNAVEEIYEEEEISY